MKVKWRSCVLGWLIANSLVPGDFKFVEVFVDTGRECSKVISLVLNINAATIVIAKYEVYMSSKTNPDQIKVRYEKL